MISKNNLCLKYPCLSKMCLLIFLGLLIWFSSLRMDYNWNWRSIPEFFVSTQSDPVFSNISGKVQTLTHSRNFSFINILSEDQHLSEFQVSKNHAKVKIGDEVIEGEKIGAVKIHKIGPLLKGLSITIWLSFVSGICGVTLGTILAFVRIHPKSIWYGAASLYIDLIRGTPLLVQLFIIYFFIGVLFNLGRETAAILALTFFSSAYFAEIIRAGFNGISSGILDSARVLGLSKLQTLRFISIPITFKRQLPALIGQFINLVKDSSLVSVIAISDLTKAGREIVASNFQTFEVWLTVAALYLLINFSLSKIAHMLEKRWLIKE